MAMEITNNYSSYAAQIMAESGAANGTKKKGTEKTQETAGNSKSKSTAEYANELAKLVPSAEFKTGNSYSTAKTGKTLAVNPKLLEKMQNDPEKEKEMKELIKGVESATKLMDGIYKAGGWSVEYRHSYIDENGKYRAIACVRNDYMLNMSDKLREERKKYSEELIEKTKEKAAEKEEKLEETLEEKKKQKQRRELTKRQEENQPIKKLRNSWKKNAHQLQTALAHADRAQHEERGFKVCRWPDHKYDCQYGQRGKTHQHGYAGTNL